MHKTLAPRLIPALLAVAFAGGAHASGFALQNQNGAGTGYAFAGSAAVAEDASTVWFNPAGMTYLPMGHNFSFAGSVIQRSLEFKNNGTLPYAGNPRFPVGGNSEGGGASLIPALYWSYAISPELRIGLGLSGPYGSETEYGNNYAGRFSAFYTKIDTIDLNPSIAYKFNDMVSIGFGVNYTKTEVELKSQVPAGAAGIVSGTELTGKVEGDDEAWGWNIGAMFQFTPSTRVGVTYRSTLNNTLEGNLSGTGPNVPLTAALKQPDNASLALSQKVGDRLEILADATWTGWSSVQSLVGKTSAGAEAVRVDFNFEDTWRFGLGGKYQLNPEWNLRAGIAYDQTPVPNTQSRTLTVPDNDRVWLSFGARWQMNKAASLDMAYAHIFMDDSPIQRTVNFPGTTRTAQVINGNVETSINIFSVQLNYNWQ
jgi:long-chain fatty acid transport protein